MEIPRRLVEERPDVLDLATRMHLAAEEYARRLKELRKRPKESAQWYGLPYLEERLYSTVCPKCGTKMAVEEGRFMRCPSCGFRAHRDNVPMIWAEKRYWEILQKTKQPAFSSVPVAITLFTS